MCNNQLAQPDQAGSYSYKAVLKPAFHAPLDFSLFYLQVILSLPSGT